MSSPYVVLRDRPLDQWKVTELKEELKRRKLTIKGLKEDLVKRLDEAVRLELEESTNDNADNGPTSGTQSELPADQEVTESVVSESIKDLVDIGIGSTEKIDGKPENEIDDQRGLLEEYQVVEEDPAQETNIAELEQEQVTKVPGAETVVAVSETVDSTTVLSGSHLDNDGIGEVRDLTAGLEKDISEPPLDDAKLAPADPITESLMTNETSVVSQSGATFPDINTRNETASSTIHLANDDPNVLPSDSGIQSLEHQVSKPDPDLRFEVVSDSISTESVTNIEKNELKVDVFTDNVTLELDVKHDMVQPSLRNVPPDGGESHPMDVEEPRDKKDVEEPLDKNVFKDETVGINLENVDSLKNIDIGDMHPPEKLSLEEASGEHPIEEDILPSKQMEYKSNSNEINVLLEKSEMPVVKEDDDVDVVGVDKPDETKVANAEKILPELQSVKRKFHDKEVGGNDTTKRLRWWTTEGLKGSEPEGGNAVASATPKDSSQPTSKRFSRSDSVKEAPKERIVPPPSKPPSNSLRIDQFLRPFTLKAVQELLGKTGTVTSFWMDHIKTHCYVSYSSIEEAVETRNAVYNLQWPPNGGRLLVAEFVDPQEVKARIEPPPVTPSSSAASTFSAQPPPTGQTQPPPRQQLLRQQQLPPPPPPPVNLPTVRERPHPLREPPSREQPLQVRDRLNLPPPPPLLEKVEPPIVTLDDLFKKTKATPRIYYLPLSDEQVATKLESQKNIN